MKEKEKLNTSLRQSCDFIDPDEMNEAVQY
jgi:hypothetical protein